MAILNKRISSATLPQLQKDARLGSIIRDVSSAPATQNEMFRTINPSASTNETPLPAYVSQLTSALRDMQSSPQNMTSRIAPTQSNNVSLMSSQMSDTSNAPNISKGPITSITSPGDSARQKIGSTTTTSGGVSSALINALAGAVMGAGASKLINGKTTTTPAASNPAAKQPVTSTVSTLPKWAQGNPTITDNKDGTYTQKNDDGSTSTMDKDGNIIGTTDSNGDIVDKNGSTVHDNGDGTHTTTARDGTVTIRNDDGTEITPSENPTNPNVGDFPIPDQNPIDDGQTMQAKRGGLAVMMKNGGVPHFGLGGEVKTQDNGNGTSTTTNADGTTVTKDDKGNIISQTDASGNIISGSDPTQSILDLLKTTGGAAGAGGLLAALLSSTGGNTTTQNTGIDMSTYGQIGPHTTNFGMGPAKYVPYKDYSQRGNYTPNAELLHNLNAPASNPVNEGDYQDPYITNRPGTTNNQAGGTDINALIAQIVNAMKNKQLTQNVAQASGTPNAGSGTPNAPAGGSNTPAASAAKSSPQFTVGGGGGSSTDPYSGYASKEAYDRAMAYNKSTADAAQAKLDAFHIAPNSPFYRYVKDPSSIPHYAGESDADAMLRVKKNAMEQAEMEAGRNTPNAVPNSVFTAGSSTLFDQNHNVIPPGPNDTNAVVTLADGTSRYVTRDEADQENKARKQYMYDQGYNVDPNKPWNVASTDTGTHTAQDALAKLNATTGTPAERQAALQNFLKTTTFTPQQLSDASNGQWSIKDLTDQMAGNLNLPEQGGPKGQDKTSAGDEFPDMTMGDPSPFDKTTSTPEQTAQTNAVLKSLGVNGTDSTPTTNAPMGGLAALATQASTPMAGVSTAGIPKTITQELDPNSGYQNPGTRAQTKEDIDQDKLFEDLRNGKPPTFNPNSIYQNPGSPVAPTDLFQQIYHRAGTPEEQAAMAGKSPEEESAILQQSLANWNASQQPATNSAGMGTYEAKGGAIHKATGGLTHYTFGKPADVMENLGLRQQQMARGGLPHVSNVPVVQGRMDFRQGSAVHGEGDGQSDDIPAMLADGEYVIDAETVAQIGNGSTKAGAQALDKFRESIRAHKRSAPINKIPPKTKALTSYLKVK